jgi:Ca2+-dependent lipid-binding protein
MSRRFFKQRKTNNKNNNMKELSTDELFNLAWVELDKMKKNTLASTILCFIVILQALFVILTGYGIELLLLVDIVCFLLYFYHDRKFKKSDKLVKEILKEIDKREI